MHWRFRQVTTDGTVDYAIRTFYTAEYAEERKSRIIRRSVFRQKKRNRNRDKTHRCVKIPNLKVICMDELSAYKVAYIL
jgi:hypothetical protein